MNVIHVFLWILLNDDHDVHDVLLNDGGLHGVPHDDAIHGDVLHDDVLHGGALLDDALHGDALRDVVREFLSGVPYDDVDGCLHGVYGVHGVPLNDDDVIILVDETLLITIVLISIVV